MEVSTIDTLRIALSQAPLSQWGFSRVGEEPAKTYALSGNFSISGKTFRESNGFGECDGTASPSSDGWKQLVQGIASSHGFTLVDWEPCEKGWGDFVFKPILDIRTGDLWESGKAKNKVLLLVLVPHYKSHELDWSRATVISHNEYEFGYTDGFALEYGWHLVSRIS